MGKLNGQNPNHPQKGSTITVDPIRSEKDIKKVKRILRDNPRDLLLFTMGINNGLRISDLLKLKVGDVREVSASETLRIKETKTLPLVALFFMTFFSAIFPTFIFSRMSSPSISLKSLDRLFIGY